MQLPYLKQKNFTNEIQNCLALAIADILSNASNKGELPVSLVIPQNPVTSKQQVIQPHQCIKIVLKNVHGD